MVLKVFAFPPLTKWQGNQQDKGFACRQVQESRIVQTRCSMHQLVFFSCSKNGLESLWCRRQNGRPQGHPRSLFLFRICVIYINRCLVQWEPSLTSSVCSSAVTPSPSPTSPSDSPSASPGSPNFNFLTLEGLVLRWHDVRIKKGIWGKHEMCSLFKESYKVPNLCPSLRSFFSWRHAVFLKKNPQKFYEIFNM